MNPVIGLVKAIIIIATFPLILSCGVIGYVLGLCASFVYTGFREAWEDIK